MTLHFIEMFDILESACCVLALFTVGDFAYASTYATMYHLWPATAVAMVHCLPSLLLQRRYHSR